MLEDEQRNRVAVRAPHQREHVQRRGTEVLLDAQVDRLGVAQRPRPVSGEAHDVRRAGHVGVEVSVGQQAVARRRTGHVTERDVHRETGTGRAGSVRLHRGERPVTVVEQHADAAGCRQRNRNVLAVPPVEVSDRDRLRGRRQGDVGAHEAHRSVLRRGPERNRPQRCCQEQRERPADWAHGARPPPPPRPPRTLDRPPIGRPQRWLTDAQLLRRLEVKLARCSSCGGLLNPAESQSTVPLSGGTAEWKPRRLGVR